MRRRPTSTTRPSTARFSPAPAEVLRQVKEQVADVAAQVRDAAADAKDEVAGQVSEVVSAVAESLREEAERVFDRQRDDAATKVTRLGKAVHQAAHALRAVRMDGPAEYVDAAGGQMERAAGYIRERELNEVLRDAGEVVDRNRGLALGGLFLAGLAAARFLKASRERAGDDRDDQ